MRFFVVLFLFCFASFAGDLKKIHVVYMTHLDLGYTAPVHDVCNQYFQKWLPAAVDLSETLDSRRKAGVTDAKFVWTQYPWLLSEYLDGLGGCGDPQRDSGAMRKVKAGIEKGQIIWHANALSAFWELADEPLFNYSLTLKEQLNHRFHKDHGRIAGKSTDVPGISRALLPTLARNGVKAMHIGYNIDMKLPDLPSMFLWRDVESGAQLLTMLESGYGKWVRACNERFCDDEALAFFIIGEGEGVPSVARVEEFWRVLKERYPSAVIIASSLDAYVAHLLSSPQVMNSLDVITGEIGDAWLYGASSDPLRMAVFRESRRQINDELKKGKLRQSGIEYHSMMRRQMKVIEHNWGLNLQHFGVFGSWDNQAFAQERSNSAAHARLEKEWEEQRAFNFPLRQKDCRSEWCLFQKRLAEAVKPIAKPEVLLDQELNMREMPLSELEKEHICGSYRVRFNAENGAIDFLEDTKSHRIWADSKHLLGLYSYRSYSPLEDAQFAKEATTGEFLWSKDGLRSDETAVGESFGPRVVAAGNAKHSLDNHCVFVFKLVVDDPRGHKDFGAPEHLYLRYIFPNQGERFFDVTLTLENKTATRHEEATFLSFVPRSDPMSAFWEIDVLGQKISPETVVSNGTRYVHATWKGVTLKDGNDHLKILALDTPIVVPGDTENFFRFGGDLPDATKGGMHFNIHNNLWPDAFPQWYGALSGQPNLLARFRLSTEI